MTSDRLLVPRTVPSALERAPQKVATAARLAVARSPLFRRAHVAVPWDLAKGLFDQARILRWTEGPHGRLFLRALAARNHQIALTAELLWREDPRVRQHLDDITDVADHLLNILDESVGIRASRAITVISPVGSVLGSEREYAQTWTKEELLEQVPLILHRLAARYRREHTSRPNWVKDITKEMHNVKPVTFYEYMRKYPALQEMVDAAKLANKGIAEGASQRG